MTVEDDNLQKMHQRISQEATEKESYKMDVSQLRRIVELHIRQLSSLVHSPWTAENYKRLKNAIETLDQEIKGRCVLTDGDLRQMKSGGPGGSNFGSKDGSSQQRSYELLRQSLHESQKRCAAYNDNMLRVAHANDELAQTLNTVKNTNKRLVDQLQYQSEEVNQLIQQRLVDEEKLEYLKKQFEKEQDSWRIEVGNKLDDLSYLQEEKFTNMKKHLTGKLSNCVGKLKQHCEETRHLKNLRDEAKEDLKNMSDHVNHDMRKVTRVFSDQLHSLATKRTEEITRLNDMLHKVQIELNAKKELREKDSDHWTQKYNTLVKEKDELQRNMDAEVQRVDQELQELEKVRRRTAEAFEEQRRQMHIDAEEFERRKASLTGMIETARRHCVQLDAANSRLEEDRQSLYVAEKQLRNDIRDSDQALADAVAANERLREQMEETRVHAQQQSERDQQLCRDSYDAKIKDQKSSHEQDVAFMEQQVRNLETNVSSRYGDVDESRHSCEKLQVESTNMQRDVAYWQSQHELANADLKALENECRDAKVTWEKEKLAAEEHMNDLISKRQNLELAMRQQQESYDEFLSTSKEKLRERKKYLDALGQRTREAELQLIKSKDDLKLATQDLARVKREESNLIVRQLEVQHELEKALQNTIRLAEDEKAGYENTLLQERRDAQQLYENFNRVREEQALTFQRWAEAPNQRISTLEREIMELQDRTKMEISTLAASVKSTTKQVESFEAEVARLQELHEESTQACGREKEALKDRKNMHFEARQRFEEDRKQAQLAIQDAEHQYQIVLKRLQDVNRRSEDDKKKIQIEIEQARSELGRRLGETERETNRLMTEYESHLGALDVKFKCEAERSRQRLDGMIRENEQLRNLIGHSR